MTAKTAASHVSPSGNLYNESDSRTVVVHGLLASTYKPGAVVYESAKGTWTIQANNAGHLSRTGVVGFKPRTSSTFGHVDIDDAYAVTDIVPIIISGKCVAAITDQNGALVRGTLLGLGTAGLFTILGNYVNAPRAVLLEDYADDDVYGLVGVGAFIHGGY